MPQGKTEVAEVSGQQLAIYGGKPVRTTPLPLEFPGVHAMDEEEVEAVTRVVRSRSPFRYYGIDPQHEAEQFEHEFAQAKGVRHAVAVSSGTGALHVALSALGVGPGQEVIIPAYLWVAVAAAVVNHGAIPVLADIDDTFCIDSSKLEQQITPRTVGIIFVHMSGAPGDIAAVLEVAMRHSLFVVEDCAQCNGGTIKGRSVGSFGDLACFSFQMNKNMTSGEGGCVATNDDRLYRRAFACHDLGYARDAQGRLIFNDPEVRGWGLGYRIDEIRAAMLRVQLRKLPAIVGRMRSSKQRIRKALEHLPNVDFRRLIDGGGDTGGFLITTYRDASTATYVNRALRAEGIVTSPQGISNIVMTDWGLHLYYNIVSLIHKSGTDDHGTPWELQENRASFDAGAHGAVRSYAKGTCPRADSLFERSILLPIPSCLTTSDEDDIILAFTKVLNSLTT